MAKKAAKTPSKEKAKKPVDPITLSVVRGILETTQREMTLSLEKTARSSVFNLAHDYSTALFNAKPEMILQGQDIPIHLGSLIPAMKIVAGFFGGVGQILLTESYRYADVSTVAPFEYTSIIWGTIAGYLLFSELPDQTLIFGTIIVIGSGIFIIYREAIRTRKLVAAREREKIIADA